MTTTPNLGLPYLDAAQAQKHVTHNDALRILDAIVQPAVLSRVVATPPATPADGDRYIVAAGATAAWVGQDGKIAAFQDATWSFYSPRTGWLVWVSAESTLLIFNGVSWVSTTGTLQNLALVGINTTADATNKLAVKSTASLFDNVGNSHQIKVNKAAAADSASLLYQDGYSGRAELGLTGDDDFHLKVSPDGSTWKEAIRLDRTTGLGTLFADPTAALGIATKQYVDARAGGAAVETEIDFGATAVKDKRFVIANATVTISSKIIALQSGKAATGRSADENEMDMLHLRASPGAGNFTLYAACLTGRVSGKFKVSYLIG